MRVYRGFTPIWVAGKVSFQVPVESCTIITTSTNQLLRPLHDRMPGILPPDDYPAWLGEDAARDVTELLRPYLSEGLRAYRVSAPTNSARNDGPGGRGGGGVMPCLSQARASYASAAQ